MFPILQAEGIGIPGWVALIAVTHVFVAHFAVGGGWYLVMTEHWGRKKQLPGVIAHAERHSRFFAMLTLVFGALSGVGIWFVIGLAAPDSTFLLIRTFVWGWATEWCFFLIELTAAMVYYRTWRRIDPKTHELIGWIYAGASIITLLVINGILSFMLTPGDWTEDKSFWSGLFNPTYWPTNFLRIAVAAAIAGMFGLLTAGREPEEETRRLLIARAARWVVAGILVAVPCYLWTKSVLPAEARHLLERSLEGAKGSVPMLGSMWKHGGMAFGLLLIGCGVIAAVKPSRMPKVAAIGILLVGLFAFGTGEYAREVLRKPYSIRGVMYANGIRPEQVEQFRKDGFLQHAESPEWFAEASDEEIGETMYRRQCSVCHTIDGYRGLRSRLAGKGSEGIGVLFTDLMKAPGQRMIWEAMPPVAGNEREVTALKKWLMQFAERSEAASGS